MNESKVEIIFGHDCYVSTPYVTHDYYEELRVAYDAEYKRSHTLEAELASLKARVAELVEADMAYDAAVYAYWIDGEENEEDREVTTERRRLALEALK